MQMRGIWEAVQRWLRPQQPEETAANEVPVPAQAEQEVSPLPQAVPSGAAEASRPEAELPPRVTDRWEEADPVTWQQAQPIRWQPPRWEEADPQGQQAGDLSRELERLARRYESLGGEGRS